MLGAVQDVLSDLSLTGTESHQPSETDVEKGDPPGGMFDDIAI